MRPGGLVVSAEQRLGRRRRAPRRRGERERQGSGGRRAPHATTRRSRGGPGPGARARGGGPRHARPRVPGPLSASGGGSAARIYSGSGTAVNGPSPGSLPARRNLVRWLRAAVGPVHAILTGLGQSRDGLQAAEAGPRCSIAHYSEDWNNSSPRWRRSAIWYVCRSARDVGLCAAAKRARATSARRAAAGRAALSTAYWRNAPSSAW